MGKGVVLAVYRGMGKEVVLAVYSRGRGKGVV